MFSSLSVLKNNLLLNRNKRRNDDLIIYGVTDTAFVIIICTSLSKLTPARRAAQTYMLVTRLIFSLALPLFCTATSGPLYLTSTGVTKVLQNNLLFMYTEKGIFIPLNALRLDTTSFI